MTSGLLATRHRFYMTASLSRELAKVHKLWYIWSMAQQSEYLTVREAARRFGVHENTIRNWSKRGILKAVTLPDSRYRRFRVKDVERVEEQREVQRASRGKAPELVDADFLDAWGGRRAQEVFPAVVQRLLASTPGIIGLNVRAGEGIGAEGWDVEIDRATGNSWVPPGASRWELGSNEGPAEKAQAEYRKRTKNPLGADPSTTCFVFATPKRWRKAQEWERRRCAEREWRDVQVIDADRLAAWLQTMPEIHLWLSEEVGLHPLEVRSLEKWWDRLSAQTRPPLSTRLVLAGRDEARDDLVRLISRGSPAAIGVRATSAEEALSFVAGSLLESRDEVGRQVVMVQTPEAWERLSLSDSPMILVAGTDADVDVPAAVARGHHAILTVRPGDQAALEIIELPRLDRVAVSESLEQIGLPHERSYRLAGLAYRSFPALLRHPQLAVATRSSPPWGKQPQARLLAPIMLVGSWTSREADQGIVAQVANTTWEEVERQLKTWGGGGDPPFVQVADHWRVASPEGAWAVLAENLDPTNLRRFAQAAEEVLGETDPSYELPEEERPFANLRGADRKYSSTLRKGLAQGLALLGAFGEDQSFPDGSSARDRARRLISILFENANKDQSGLLWCSLSNELPLLAEAAPDEFLTGLEDGIKGPDPVVRGIFKDGTQSSALFPSSPHSSLLWALETISWSADHFGRAALALARLVEIDDPRGQLGNRPDASLRSLFLPWFPQTSASLDDRVRVLDRILERHPKVGWQLQLDLLPKTHDTTSPLSSPRFRTWTPSEQGADLEEQLQAIAALTERVVQAAGGDLRRWAQLVEPLNALPQTQREQVIAGLERLPLDEAAPTDRLILWRELVDEIGRHRAYPEAKWSLDDAALKRLDAIASKAEPQQFVERHARLFDWHPELGTAEERQDYATWQQTVATARAEAIREVVKTAGFDGLKRLAMESPLPRQVGISAAEVMGEEFKADMLKELGGPDGSAEMASGWIAYLARDHGDKWITSILKESGELPADSQVRLFLALPPKAGVWKLLGQVEAAVATKYWSLMDPLFVEAVDTATCVEHLLEHERPWVALDLLSLRCGETERKDRPDPALVERVLDPALQSDSPDRIRGASVGYEVGVLLDYLEESGADPEVLVKLEWSYFPVLEDGRRTPRALYAALAEEPDLFVGLVRRVFRAKHTPRKRNPSEHEVAQARHAWEVLNAWRTVPGGGDGEKIDPRHLRNWVRKARLALEDADRLEIGDEQIGQLLSGSPPGKDGIWPAEPVRDLLEEIGSPDLESGLQVGRYNSRGITSRGPYDGGDQERALSEQYSEWASATRERWERTSRVLQGLADGYLRDARREDAAAQRDAADD
jgi:Helix-turn-helix domain